MLFLRVVFPLLIFLFFYYNMKSPNSYSVLYYFNSKITYPRFFVVFKFFWYCYINNSYDSNKVNLTIKLKKKSRCNQHEDNWIIFSNQTFNTFDFDKAILYFENLFNQGYDFEVSEILFLFSFDSRYNNMSVTKYKRMFSFRYIFFIIFINSIFSVTLTLIVLSYLYAFDTIQLISDIEIIDLINNECENLLSNWEMDLQQKNKTWNNLSPVLWTAKLITN